MPTTNPVPSTDPSDLLFNAGKLDEVVNGSASSFTDRLGATRRTVAGMNADFDAQLADAESDLNVYRADAAASAAEALGYLQTIRATSYGAYASDPETDPLGNPPTVGDEYFNTTSNLLKRWNGSTWQASDINTANLAAPSGSSLVGYDGGTVQDVLDSAKSLQDYAALRTYTGRATRVYITGLLGTAKPAGISGVFQYDQTDTTSADNGGTIIIGADGRRWKRDFAGDINTMWFLTQAQAADVLANLGTVDVTSQVLTAVAAAVAAKRGLHSPAGTYLMAAGGFSINTPINFYGDGSQNTIFKFPSGAGNSFAVSQGAAVVGLRLSGFQLLGALGGKVGLKLGDGNISNSTADSSFRDIRISNMSLGLSTVYAWSNVYDNIRCQSCTKPAAFESQTNNSVLNACDFVTFTTPVSFSNCEGLVLNAPNISNFTGATSGFTTFQSNITINSPYFENNSTVIGSIGSSGETYPSQVSINCGITGSGKFVINRVGTVFKLDGIRPPADGNSIFIDNPTASPFCYADVYLGRINNSVNPKIDPVFDLNFKRPTFLAGAYGGSVRTMVVDREFFTITQTTSGNGLTLFTGLSVGKQYVLEYTTRAVAGITEGPSIRLDAEGSLGFIMPTDAEQWQTRRIFFVAQGTTLRLLFQGSIQFKAIRIYEGISNVYSDIPVASLGPWYLSAAPTAGTWVQGDIVWNTAAAAGGTPGWVCTAAGSPGTWKAMASLAA